MKLIDRYVYAVTENLQTDTKEDVSRELRANIEDMLPDDATEADVREVLEELGNPKKLASEYSEAKRYLIGPELYDNYISILKLVVFIVAAVAACVSLLEDVFSLTTSEVLLENAIGIFVNVVVGTFNGAVQGFLWVTLVFVILERTGVSRVGFSDGKVSLLKNKWSVKDLPEIPVGTKGRISRGETLVSMIFTVIFTAVIYSNAHLIGIYTKSGRGITLVESLFDDERLRLYMPLFLILALFQFSVSVWKFITRKWNIPLAITNTLCNIAVCILMFIMISDAALFNQGFVKKITESVSAVAPGLLSILAGSIKVFIIIFVLISLWDSISGFIKSKS